MSSIEGVMSGETASNVSNLHRNKKLRKNRRKKDFSSKMYHRSITDANNENHQKPVIIKENEELKQTNHEQRERIFDLQQKIDKLNAILSGQHIALVGKGSNLISNKIIELNRKNRHLCNEMEIYRAKCDKLKCEITKIKAELISKENKTKESLEIEPNQVQELKEKIKSVTNKLLESYNQNTSLKNEIKLVMKCLKKEIGGNKPIFIQNLLKNGGIGWRGRAQQILSLQTKVMELSKKLDVTENDTCREKHRQMEFARKCEVESLRKETKELKAIINNMQFKLIASKARIKNLVEENASYKLKCQNLIDGKKEAEEKMSNLTSDLNSIKSIYEVQLKTLTKKIEMTESKSQICHTTISQAMCEVENKNDLLFQKDSEICMLHRELEEIQNDMRQVTGNFFFNCRHLQKHQYLAILNNLEEEKSQILSQMEKLHIQLRQERDTINSLHVSMAKQKLKIFRQEVNLSKMIF